MADEVGQPKRLIIYGNGSVARILLSYVDLECVACCTVDDAYFYLSGPTLYDVPVVRFDEIESRYPCDNHAAIVAVGFHDINGLREFTCNRLAKMGYLLETFVHPSARLGIGVTVGSGSIILDQVSVHPGAKIGDGVFISSNVNIGHDVSVGNFCFVNSGVAVAGWSGIGARSFLGINASIGDSIELGERNYIGANTLITRSTGDDEVWISPSGEKFRMKSADFLNFIGT